MSSSPHHEKEEETEKSNPSNQGEKADSQRSQNIVFGNEPPSDPVTQMAVTQETPSTGLREKGGDNAPTSSTPSKRFHVFVRPPGATHHPPAVAAAAVAGRRFSSGADSGSEQQPEEMSIGEVSTMASKDDSILSSDFPLPDNHDNQDDTKTPRTGKSEDYAKAPRRKRTQQPKPGQSSGRWTQEEHQAFLEGLKIFGREWKKVAERIPTRTSAQIRSHAQKYFAKLAREDSLLVQEQVSSPSSQPIPQPMSPQGDSGTAVNSSVQRNAERILANPGDVQREVEDTLRQLRERYRQLQIRLEETQRGRNRFRGRSISRIVENEPEDEEEEGNSKFPGQEPSETARSPGSTNQGQGRKRTLEDASGFERRRTNQDDASSVSSAPSSLSPSRELGSEELIALHVLGESLSRSSSHQHLPLARAPVEEARPSSPSSSLSSNHEPADESVDSSGSKRRRLSGESHSDDDNSNPGAGDSSPRDDGTTR